MEDKILKILKKELDKLQKAGNKLEKENTLLNQIVYSIYNDSYKGMVKLCIGADLIDYEKIKQLEREYI